MKIRDGGRPRSVAAVVSVEGAREAAAASLDEAGYPAYPDLMHEVVGLGDLHLVIDALRRVADEIGEHGADDTDLTALCDLGTLLVALGAAESVLRMRRTIAALADAEAADKKIDKAE